MNKTVSTVILLLAIILGQFFPAAQPAYAAGCDAILFIADVTVPDNSAYSPGAAFTKTWRLKNVGSCTWTTAYKLVFAGGSQMSGPSEVNLPATVEPNATVDLSLNLVAPVPAGTYRGNWQLKNADGALFGIGSTADKPFWVQIVTRAGSAVTPVPVGEAYNFAFNTGSAQSWISGAGALPFPGTDGDARGFAQKLDGATLETGETHNSPTLLMVPQNKSSGYIQGLFPALAIQSGDRFQALIGCQHGATACFVTYRIDYRTSAGVKTLWTFREKYEGLTYQVNIDLSFLAGKNVEFFLMVLAGTSATGDRALWVNPRIARTGGGTPPTVVPSSTPIPNTPLPGVTPPTPTATSVGPTKTPAPSSGCDRATFVTDLNVPDGSVFAPNATFTKTWRLRNSGTCSWTTAYKLVFVSGEQMGGPGEMALSSAVARLGTVDLSVNLKAPATPGTYRGYWQLKNASGALFGIGSAGDKPFWVEIVVRDGGTPSTPVPGGTSGYDFAAQAGKAQGWTSGAGALPFPGTDGDARGFAIKLDSVQLETGETVNQPTLLMVPQNKSSGYIQGLFPAITIQNGDRFQATIGCQSGATACSVTYRIDYRTPAGVKTLWTFREKYEGLTYNVNLDLSFLAGKNTEFFMLVLAGLSATGDRALWVNPRIVRTGGGTLPPTAAVPTSTPVQGSWLTYTNQKYQFQFQYPPEGQLSNAEENSVHIDLPKVPGTNLSSKYLDMSVTENVSSCSSLPVGGAGPSQPVTFNGIAFNKETGVDVGAGQRRDWTLYYTLKDNACVAMGFVLHSNSIGALPEGTPEFNFEAESAVFTQMMSTFTWLSSGSTTKYAVVNVADTLNVRSAAGTTNPIVAYLGYNANDIARTGASTTVGSVEWWQIFNPGEGTGWVNSPNLTEYVPSANFCSDSKVNTLLTNLGNALNNSDGAAFAALVSPRHGVNIRLASFYAPTTINFTKTKAASIFTDATLYNWGSAPCSDQIPGSTFGGEVRPKMLDVYNSPDLQMACNDLSKVGTVAQPWPNEYANINFYSLHKPSAAGFEDWRTLLVGTEYVNGQPYVFALYNYQWTC